MFVCVGLRVRNDGQESVYMNCIKGNAIPPTIRSRLMLLGNKLSELKRYRILNKQEFFGSCGLTGQWDGYRPRVLQLSERTTDKNMQFFSG